MDVLNLTPDQLAALRLEAAHEFWRRGMLDFKRHATQRKIKAAIQASEYQRHFLLCSRRLGKSYEFFLAMCEYAIQHPGSRILYLAPFAKNADEIANDIAVQVFADCPPDVKPEYKAQAKEFHFKNGAIIRLKGVNGEHAQYLRGGAAHLVILDEVGLMHDLEHVISDVVAPMTMTTQGKILFATTPARSPGHESTSVYNRLADLGAVSLFTIRDAPHVDDRIKGQFLLDAGEKAELIPDILAGLREPETTTARREYFCQFVTDADTAVLPEFDADARKAICIEYPRPPFFDAYVGMDPGFNDKTGILFGYWDFKAGKLVIEDEALLHRAATPEIAKTIALKEETLYGFGHKPLLRVSDIDLRLIADLWSLHGLQFSPADKKDSEGAINYMRTMISSRQIIILPRCTNLIRQMQNATFDSKGKDFERTAEDSHYDLVAALKYLCRSINKHKNPYPVYLDRTPQGMWLSPSMRRKTDYGLLGSTPFGRRVVKNQK